MTSQQALNHLNGYARGQIDPEDAIEVDALIEQYLEGMLDPETAVEVERAIDADARLAKMVEEARRGGIWLDDVMAPKAQSFLDQPLSPSMVKFTEDVIAGKIQAEPDQDEDERVVPFQAPVPEQRPTWRPWLMAASITGLLIAGGAGTYIAKARLDEAASRQFALEEDINQLTSERDDQQARIGKLDGKVAGLLDDLSATDAAKNAAEGQIARLESQRGDLEQRVADLQGEISVSTHREERLDQQRAALASEFDQLQTDLTNADMRLAETSITLTERNERLAVLEGDLEQLTIDLAETVTSRDQTQANLASAEATIAELGSTKASLEEQVTALNIEGHRNEKQAEDLADKLRQLQADLAQTATARDELLVALTANQHTIALFEERLTEMGSALADAEQIRNQTRRQLVDARSQNSKLRDNLTGAEQQMAALALQEQTVTATLANRDRLLAEAEQQLEITQAEATDAKQQIAQLAIDRRDLEIQLAGQQQQRRWSSQVADYHRYFATQPPRRWAEVPSKDPDAIQQYLADLGRDLGLDRPVPLPSVITEAGFKFVGGRTLVINGMPVAQLGYMDSQKKLLAFCFMRNPSGEIEPIRPSRAGDLRMLAWRDSSFQYVVIGYESIGALGNIAGQLQRGYDLET